MVITTLPPLPAIVRGEVRHERRSPWRHALSFKTYEWLVDLDQPFHNSVLARLSAADHFGGADEPLRTAVERFAHENGEQVLPGDRILMLAAARSFGYVFNPLSVYWCIAQDQRVRWAILEIHNTYGDRHAHVIHLDDLGKCRVQKEFYVSPFFTIEGEYAVRAVLDESHAHVSVNLHQHDKLVFTASFSGTPLTATRLQLLRAALRTPFAAQQTMVRIKAHGIWLWLRRLPVVPRPEHKEQVGMR